MRREELPQVVDALREPMRRFVKESRVRTCVLVSSAGQVLAQHGFTRRFEIVNVASLAAAAHAAAGALAQITGAERWTHLYNDGRRQQLFLAPFQTPAGELILVAILDETSSLGLVQLFFDQLVGEVRGLAALSRDGRSADAGSFERDLEAGARRILQDPAGEA